MKSPRSQGSASRHPRPLDFAASAESRAGWFALDRQSSTTLDRGGADQSEQLVPGRFVVDRGLARRMALALEMADHAPLQRKGRLSREPGLDGESMSEPKLLALISAIFVQGRSAPPTDSKPSVARVSRRRGRCEARAMFVLGSLCCHDSSSLQAQVAAPPRRSARLDTPSRG